MIYLQRHTIAADSSETIEIAVVESARHAERYESLGYTRCSAATFRAAWRERDARSLAQLRAVAAASAPVAPAPPADAWRNIYHTIS
jgi:hypothetical protein